MFVEATAGHVNFLAPVMNAHSKSIESATSHLREGESDKCQHTELVPPSPWKRTHRKKPETLPTANMAPAHALP